MTDGNLIFDDAAALAFPRYPGTEGDARAISWLESRFQETGLETTLQWFTYDLGPALCARRVVLVASAMLLGRTFGRKRAAGPVPQAAPALRPAAGSGAGRSGRPR